MKTIQWPGLFVLALLVTQAAPQEPFLKATTCMSERYAEAVECLNSMLYSTPSSDTLLLAEVYKELGICYFMLEKNKLASSSFEKLLLLSPDYELDPKVYLPDIIALFQIIKNDLRSKAVVDAIPPYHPALNYLPFGAPQVLNRERRKAGIFLGVQVLALAASIYMHSQRQDLDQGGRMGYAEEDFEQAKSYADGQRAFFVLFSVSYVAGVIDGIWHRPDLARKRRAQ